MTGRVIEGEVSPFQQLQKTGRVCSLHFRPRRWFGCRLEKILGDFLETSDVRLSGLRQAALDLLTGVVRRQGDERVLVSAHQIPETGAVQIEVTVFFSVPTDEPEHVQAIVGYLGRSSRTHNHYRLGTREGALPVQAQLRVATGRVRAQHGESFLVTTYSFRSHLRVAPEVPNRGRRSRHERG